MRTKRAPVPLDVVLALVVATALPQHSLAAFRADPVWTIEAVDSGGDVGRHASIALDTQGYPHISYYDATNRTLKYARRTAAGWQAPETVPDPSTSYGTWCSIAVAPSGPCIGYVENQGDPIHLRYTARSGTVWTPVTVEQAGLSVSLVLDSAGRPRMAAVDYPGGFVQYSANNGSTWSVEYPDSAGNYQFTSFTDLALDSADKPHIAFTSPSGNLVHASKTGVSWGREPLTSGGAASPSIAVDAVGTLHIAYQATTPKDLRYYRSSGGIPTNVAVDSTGDVGRYPSLALESTVPYRPQIAYFDSTGRHLKYAYRNGSTWTSMTVDPAAGVGQWASLAIDSFGMPHVAYYDQAGKNLKYAWVQHPILSLAPASLEFPLRTDSLVVTTRNAGTGALTWTIGAHPAWISVVPSGGSTTVEVDSLLVIVDRTGLSGGVHEGHILVSGNGGTDSVAVAVVAGSAVTVASSSYPYPPAPGGLTFTATGDSTLVSGMSLHSRRAGTAGAFAVTGMTQSGGTFTATLPGTALGEDGLEYYLEYEAGAFHVVDPAGGAAAPAYLAAVLQNKVIATTQSAKRYVLFGLPLVATNSQPEAVLGDDLGSYDVHRWGCGRYDPVAEAYAEYPNVPAFLPGRGYWIVQKDPVAFGSPGRSTSTSGGFRLVLSPGWNQLAHPYLFSVAVADLDYSAAPHVERRIWTYDGAMYASPATLSAWTGFWMRNNGSGTETVIVPGTLSTARVPAAVAPVSGWRLRIREEQEGLWSAGEVGFAPGAEDGPDLLDFHSPPALPGAPRAFVATPDALGRPHELAVDVRPEGRGAIWELVISAPGTAAAHVSFEGAQSVPTALDVVLFPVETEAPLNVRTSGTLTLAGGRQHRFRLVVGDHAFLDDVQAGRLDPPHGVWLGVPYPTPSRGATSVAFAIPGETHARLGVFDVQGRRVRELESRVIDPGRYTATWDGDDDAGRRVAPGVYFVVLRAGSATRVAKVVQLR